MQRTQETRWLFGEEERARPMPLAVDWAPEPAFGKGDRLTTLDRISPGDGLDPLFDHPEELGLRRRRRLKPPLANEVRD